ncbi:MULTISPECIES: DUF2502 domain-containing protein [unclassified Serratia (in: enterobacteria)]|uniref:DUF2502 domain-containing protein n=1 Tax=unclassified Serratia (in: enterobacteria) TaxID=2647522 RepID=UPI0030765615
MKKILLLVCLPLLLPRVAQANVSVDVNVPGVSVHLGDQDRRGYYWDGYDWRPPQWWHAHQGHGVGERNERGMYWDGGRWQPVDRRNQAERGRNPFHDDRNPSRNSQSHGDRGNQRGDNASAHGRPYPQNDNDPRH